MDEAESRAKLESSGQTSKKKPTLLQLINAANPPDKELQNFDLQTEPGTPSEFEAFLKSQSKKLIPPNYEPHPDRGTQFGGGRLSAAQMLAKDNLMLRTAELYFEKSILMDQGQAHLRNNNHNVRVNDHWDYIETTLRKEGFTLPKDIRDTFNTFKNNTRNKHRGNHGSGQAYVALTPAEEYIVEKERKNQGVTGIKTSDAGAIPVRKNPPRNAPHNTFTFPTPRKRAAPDNSVVEDEEEQEDEEDEEEQSFDSPPPPGPSSSKRIPRRASLSIPSTSTSQQSGKSRSTRQLRSSTRSSQHQATPNFFDNVFIPTPTQNVRRSSSRETVPDDTPASQATFAASAPSSSSTRQKRSTQTSSAPSSSAKAKKNDKQDKTGLDKAVALGPTPKSQRSMFVQEELSKLTSIMQESASLINKETEQKTENNRANAPKVDELMALTKEKLQNEADAAKYLKEQRQHDAEQSRLNAMKTQAELELTLLKLRKAQREENN